MKMKNIKRIVALSLTSTILLLSHTVYAVDLPTIKSEGQTLDDFIPSDWSLMPNGSIKGDLNNDGLDDIAAIFESNKTIMVDQPDGNKAPIKPRTLAILLAQKEGGYKLSSQVNHGVLDVAGGPVMENPITFLKIRRGALHVGYTGGDVDKNHWEIVARFRYKNGDWYMMGYNKSNYVAATSQVIKND